VFFPKRGLLSFFSFSFVTSLDPRVLTVRLAFSHYLTHCSCVYQIYIYICVCVCVCVFVCLFVYSQQVVIPSTTTQISYKLVDLLMEISEITPHRSNSWTRWLASSSGKSRVGDHRAPSSSYLACTRHRRASDRVPMPTSPRKMPTLPPVAPMDSCRMDSRFKHSSFEYVCVDIELPTNDAVPKLRTRILEPPSKQYPPRVLVEFQAGRLRVQDRQVTSLHRRGRLSLVQFQTDNSLHLQWSDRQRRAVYLVGVCVMPFVLHICK
jgi:Proteasome complex subunit Rpn13, Pru domain